MSKTPGPRPMFEHRGRPWTRRQVLALGGASLAMATTPRPLCAAAGQKPYRTAIIGHTGKGNYGHGLDKVWLHVPQAKVVAVADADAGGAAAVAKLYPTAKPFTDYRRMLDEMRPELVSIGPRWIDQHRDMVVAAAERGVRGIYLEKPLCRNLAEADEMVAICRKNNTKVALAYVTRYSPKLPLIDQLIASGKLGRVLEIRARGKEDHRGGGEDFWVLGAHVLDLILHFGGTPKWCMGRILAEGRPIERRDIKPGNEGIHRVAGDEVHVTYQLSGGSMAHFDSVRDAADGARFGLSILGSKGMIQMTHGYMPEVGFLADPSWMPLRGETGWVSVSSSGPGTPEPLQNVIPDQGNVAAVEDLIESIRRDRPPKADLLAARTGLEMLMAAYQSQRLEAPVLWPLRDRNDPMDAF
jgi:predicted dehydrogenase